MSDVCMRTTLTLDDEIAERLQSEASYGKCSFKQIVNDALRRGLGIDAPLTVVAFCVQPHSSAFQPGVDAGRLNQLVDELEVAEFQVIKK